VWSPKIADGLSRGSLKNQSEYVFFYLVAFSCIDVLGPFLVCLLIISDLRGEINTTIF
jgi:hypothetical protein